MSDTISDALITELRRRIEKDLGGFQITVFQVKSDHDQDSDPIIGLQIAYDETGEEPRPYGESTLALTLR